MLFIKNTQKYSIYITCSVHAWNSIVHDFQITYVIVCVQAIVLNYLELLVQHKMPVSEKGLLTMIKNV